MERITKVEVAKQLFGENFIGVEEITKLALNFGIELPVQLPEIPYTIKELESHSTDCILILGTDKLIDGNFLNLLSMREKFGINPDKFEPCFYNQDWYLKEDFIQSSLENKWYLIKKEVFDDSRAILPDILEKKYKFPTAVLCAYVFFMYWFHTKIFLWEYDFIWCEDLDHNGDRIYVGKYLDIEKMNKNGFSIHRHLALRNTYATIAVY